MYAFGPALLAAILDTTAGYRPALTLCIALEVAAAVMVRACSGRRIRCRSPAVSGRPVNRADLKPGHGRP